MERGDFRAAKGSGGGTASVRQGQAEASSEERKVDGLPLELDTYYIYNPRSEFSPIESGNVGYLTDQYFI